MSATPALPLSSPLCYGNASVNSSTELARSRGRRAIPGIDYRGERFVKWFVTTWLSPSPQDYCNHKNCAASQTSKLLYSLVPKNVRSSSHPDIVLSFLHSSRFTFLSAFNWYASCVPKTKVAVKPCFSKPVLILEVLSVCLSVCCLIIPGRTWGICCLHAAVTSSSVSLLSVRGKENS